VKRFGPAACLMVLVACGTPQEQCIARETRDLRVMDGLIADTEGNIARGYAIETYTETVTFWGTCQTRVVDGTTVTLQPQMCLRDREERRTRNVAIDLNDERRKLDSMRAKRRDLARAAEGAITACKAAYPA
jgi:hypothetical protein